MKKITAVFFAFLTTAFTFAQTKIEKQATQAEQFSSTAGTLIEKQFIDIGEIKGISIQIMKLKDLNSSTSKTALRFEYEYKSSYASDTKIALLDLDEIDGLIKSMVNLKNNVFNSARDVYTEVTFRSRTGFEAGAYYDTGKVKWFTYIKLEKYDGNSQVFINTEDFAGMLALIELAKTKM